MSGTLQVHPRLEVQRARPWGRAWWARAWVRAVEESAYASSDLARGRSLARAAAVGGIGVGPGEVRAAVVDGEHLCSVRVEVPVLDETAALVEVVAAEPDRAAALLRGELDHDLVEHAEEAGVELLPDGRELSASGTCAAWVDPCPHALAVLLQLGWLVDDDPLVLLHLRGLARDDLLAALHAREPEVGAVEIALDAAERARRLLAALEGDGGHREDGPGDLDHLW